MRDKLLEIKDIVAIVANELEELNNEKGLDGDNMYNLTDKLDNAYNLIEEVELFLDNLVGEL